MMTIEQHISRIRNNFNLTSSDTIITDRFIYLLMKKHRDFVVKRDRLQKIIYQNNLFQTIKFEELIEVDSVEACQIQSACRIKRTKERIPELMEGNYGVLLRWVGSLDGSQEVKKITSNAFQRKLRKNTYKYNDEKYYWYSDGYLYFPELEWDAIKIEGYFQEEVMDPCEDDGKCSNIREQSFRISDYLVSQMDQMVFQDLHLHANIPYDEHQNDNINLK